MTKNKISDARGISRRAGSLATVLLGMAATAPMALAQTGSAPSSEENGEGSSLYETDEIIVQSTRRDQRINDIARSVRVFNQDDLGKFLEQTTSIQEILGRVVPGFAPPVTEGSAGSLTLRGRDPLFLIDGVPVASNTNFSRFLDKFDPLTIGNVEVVYGPTSLYGAGATGGVIQFFTQEPVDGPLQFGLGTFVRAFAPSEDAFNGDGVTTKVNGSVSGSITDWLGVYAYASYENIGGSYRSEGDLLTGRSNFSEDVTLFGKLKADLAPSQTLTFTINRTSLQPRDRQFELDVVDAGDGTVIAAENPFPFSYAEPPTNEFLYTSLSYKHDDLFDGSLSALFYFSDSEFLNPGSDLRSSLRRNGGNLPNEWPGLWQSGRNTEEFGVRAQYNRTFLDRINAAIGFDYNSADSTSLLPISTEESFDDTLFFDAATSGFQNPPFTLDAVGVFFESTIDLTKRFAISGGVRWDQFDYEVVGPYDVTFFFPDDQAGERPGGAGTSDGVSWNLGATYDVIDGATLFANYSQGFAIPSLGFVGNTVAPGVPVSDSELVAPVITDSFEAGVRGASGAFRYSLAGYYSESEFETSVAVDPFTGLALRGRAPVEIFGLEVSAGFDIGDFTIDGYVTWVEGEVDPNDDGESIAMSTQEIPPVQFTLNPRYQFTDDLSVFGQLFFVGDRSDGFESGLDANPAEGYALVDIGVNYRVDAGEFGGGLLSLQVTNLLNEEYIPAGEATFIPGRIQSGIARAVTLSYQHTF